MVIYFYVKIFIGRYNNIISIKIEKNYFNAIFLLIMMNSLEKINNILYNTIKVTFFMSIIIYLLPRWLLVIMLTIIISEIMIELVKN
jgi:hypothetical protein